MEPIPETERAVDEFGPFSEGDLLAGLRARCARVRRVVPTTVGMSLASREHGVTFTLVATDAEIAALDAVQYAAGGPCVDAAEAERVEVFHHDPGLITERGWQLFARATAARGVASTLTLPVVAAGEVVGTVNLYAASPEAFAGHHATVAAIFGAWAPGAVTNADLSFSTRLEAQRAPHVLHEETRLMIAVGIVARLDRTDTDAALAKLCDVAARAGIELADLAEVVIALREGWERG